MLYSNPHYGTRGRILVIAESNVEEATLAKIAADISAETPEYLERLQAAQPAAPTQPPNPAAADPFGAATPEASPQPVDPFGTTKAEDSQQPTNPFAQPSTPFPQTPAGNPFESQDQWPDPGQTRK